MVFVRSIPVCFRSTGWLVEFLGASFVATIGSCDARSGGDQANEPSAAVAGSQAALAEAVQLEKPPPPAPAPPSFGAVPPRGEETRVALAWQFNAPVYSRPHIDSTPVGIVRRNATVPVERFVGGSGCRKGSWYEVVGGGYVCTTHGFNVDRPPVTLADGLEIEPAAVDSVLPFRYAKVDVDAPLYRRIPSAKEQERAASPSRPAPVLSYAQGVRFIAVDSFVEAKDGREFVRSTRGFYVNRDQLKLREPPTMRGEVLDGAKTLPLAFVYRDDIDLVEPDSGAVIGKAEKHARYPVVAVDDTRGLVVGDGFAAPIEEVRVVEAVPRPDDVPADGKWIHVNLDRQTLVAYEGDRPVYATLISSGKEGYEPPLGLFRVHKKYISKTMSGEDDVDGSYDISQVPWIQYYWGSYALHGAYWHEEFGAVRSHGCTNIPPYDARWLFFWGDPTLPTGWHGTIGRRGPWVYFSRDLA